MSREQNQSNSVNAQELRCGCCREEWEDVEPSLSANSAEDESEQELPSYYLPCAD